MIEIKNLSKYYSNNGVTTLGLRDINLSFQKNEIVGIVGESGSGKSTLLNVISGMDSYDDGEIFYNGEETSYFDERDRDEFRKKNVAFINQNYNIIDSYSVLDNVTLPLLINGMDEASAKKRAVDLIERVNLTHRIKSKGSQLSGGEKQRCVIARALAKDTPILACDEPTGNLDSKSGEDIINLIKEVAEDKLVLIVTHNEEQANPILTRKIKIHDGQVAEDISMASFAKSDKEDQPALTENKKNHALRWSMAMKNIKGTPKKNIFTSLVFTAFSFGLMFLYLLATQTAYNAGFFSSSNFLNLTHERMIVYREDRKALDTSKLSSIKGDKYENAFYEDKAVYLVEEISNYGYYGNAVAMTYQMPKNAEIQSEEGMVDTNKINATLVQSSKSNRTFSGSDVGRDKYVISSLSMNAFVYGKIHISKIANCDDIETPILVLDKSTDVSFLNKSLNKDYEISSINIANGDPYTNDNALINSCGTGNTLSGDKGLTKNTLVHRGRTELAQKPASITATIGGLYETKFADYDYDFQYLDTAVDEFTFYCVSLEIPSECYEMTIYADNTDVAANVAKAAGYQYIIPSKAASERAKLTNYGQIINVFLYVMVTLLGFVMSFAVFGILSRVYVTKTKDFTIFRSLGVLKKDLRAVLSIEVNILAFISSLISVVALVILGFATEYFSNLMGISNPLMFIFFILIIQLLAWFIANRFNKHIFKLSITDSLKEERR